MKPFQIFVDGRLLEGYTDATLQREKHKLTGSLSISLFMGYLPESAVLPGATRGSEILVYVGGHLAFTGNIDRREDNADSTGKPGKAPSLNVGPNNYTVRLTCRGKTKALIESSQQHPTGTMLGVSNKEAIENLLEPWRIELDWLAAEVSLGRVRLRDGGRVVDEIQRLAEKSGIYCYETRDGKLRVTDTPPAQTGESLVLGKNILSFSAKQEGDWSRSQVLVKGQLNSKDSWGVAAVIPPLKLVADVSLTEFTPITVQVSGDATQDILERRATYEVNRRAAETKKVRLDVFNILQANGLPWDLGVLHYVDIPPAGIKGVFEVTGLTYTARADKTLKTSLTLTPPPAPAAPSSSTTPSMGTGESGARLGFQEKPVHQESTPEWGAPQPEVLDIRKGPVLIPEGTFSDPSRPPTPAPLFLGERPQKA